MTRKSISHNTLFAAHDAGAVAGNQNGKVSAVGACRTAYGGCDAATGLVGGVGGVGAQQGPGGWDDHYQWGEIVVSLVLLLYVAWTVVGVMEVRRN